MNEKNRDEAMRAAVAMGVILVSAPLSAYLGFHTLKYLTRRAALKETGEHEVAVYNEAIRKYNAAVVKFNETVVTRMKGNVFIREVLEEVDQEAYDAAFDEIMRQEF